MRFTVRDIQNILDGLDRFRPARLNLNAKRNFSRREAVFFMAPELKKMKEAGFTFKELAAILAEHEINIKPSTLNRYLSQYQAGLKEEVANKAEEMVLAEMKAAPPAETISVPADVIRLPEPMRLRDQVKSFASRICRRKSLI
jgi:DNA-binding transcriptional MerR regulator